MAKPRGPSPGPHQATMTCAPAVASSGCCSAPAAVLPATIERARRRATASASQRAGERGGRHRRARSTSSVLRRRLAPWHRRSRPAGRQAARGRGPRSSPCRRRPGCRRSGRAAPPRRCARPDGSPWIVSQPRPTTSAAPTLGLVAVPDEHGRVCVHVVADLGAAVLVGDRRSRRRPAIGGRAAARAHDRRQHEHVVARAQPAVGAAVAADHRALRRRPAAHPAGAR